MGAVLETMLWIANKGGTTIIAAAGITPVPTNSPVWLGLVNNRRIINLWLMWRPVGLTKGWLVIPTWAGPLRLVVIQHQLLPTVLLITQLVVFVMSKEFNVVQGRIDGLISVVLAEPTPGSETYEFAYWGSALRLPRRW